jgi:aminoglycoside phosphotransferase
MYGTQGAVMQAIFSEEFSDEQTTAAFSASTVRPSGSTPASTMKARPVSPFAETLGDSSSLLWFGVCGLPCGQVLGMTGSSVMFAIG